jgi:hypothetical protein
LLLWQDLAVTSNVSRCPTLGTGRRLLIYIDQEHIIQFDRDKYITMVTDDVSMVTDDVSMVTANVSIATNLVSMRRSEFEGCRTVLQISSCVAGIAVWLDTHRSDR